MAEESPGEGLLPLVLPPFLVFPSPVSGCDVPTSPKSGHGIATHVFRMREMNIRNMHPVSYSSAGLVVLPLVHDDSACNPCSSLPLPAHLLFHPASALPLLVSWLARRCMAQCQRPNQSVGLHVLG